eukprot:21511-Prorocentrum_lima.AAC.1
MTSSLVGSEMCIRDRCDSGHWGGGVLEHESVYQFESKIGRVVPLHVHCAVSYTHLTLPTICSV